jgi:hypothetical protein
LGQKNAPGVAAQMSSPLGAGEHVHQFRDFSALVGLVAGGDRVLDAMGDEIAAPAPAARARRRTNRFWKER